MDYSILPSVNAVLNTTTAILLVTGYLLIRQRRVNAHKRCMLTACVTSSLFLTSYVYYHLHHGTTHFPGHGWVRTLYFIILLTHTILAIVQVPMIIRTLVLAFSKQLEKHKRLARFTLPIWLYVSVTGVIVYFMLYRISYNTL